MIFKQLKTLTKSKGFDLNYQRHDTVPYLEDMIFLVI